MIGMHFGAFLTLLILSFIAAIVMHSAIRYRMLEGFDGFLAKWVVGWIGAWIAAPVLGHWWFQIQNIYIIPALVGAFAAAFSLTAFFKASARSAVAVTSSRVTSVSGVPEMIRKAG